MDDCDPEKSFLGPNIGEKVYVLIDGPLEELEEYLKQDGKDLPESHDNKIRNLLGYAVASNRIDHVKLLLDKGANPDILGIVFDLLWGYPLDLTTDEEMKNLLFQRGATKFTGDWEDGEQLEAWVKARATPTPSRENSATAMGVKK
eukprot:TRINITY_DN1125_c0_g1_i14.p1 TRINITY_DN1125_c0_g1~~TRINITY_DN1125_c0_g1_i14.p1  ORF type:complete len:146 (+),score=45.37 TRINITY_DN1125_c0_g1_i14:150-587(+)